MTIFRIHYAGYFLLGVLFLFGITSCSFSAKQSLKLYEKAKNHQYDVVVVPGVPLENGRWSDIMKLRNCWSKYLYDRGIARNVMFSGNAVYTPYVESEVMALYAAAIGIPKENIYTESKAEHSTENIYYSYKKAKQLKFNRIALASDAFQTRMLRRFTRLRVSKDIDLIPAVYDSLRNYMATIPEPVVDPASTFVPDFEPLPERKSFTQRLKGTIGWDRDKSAYE